MGDDDKKKEFSQEDGIEVEWEALRDGNIGHHKTHSMKIVEK